MKIYNYGTVLTIVVICLISALLGYYFGFNTINAQDGVYSNKIAVVNLDVAQEYNGETIKISENVINTMKKIEKYEFEIVSDPIAEQGMENNKYVAKITFPSDFTLNILTVNDENPNKVKIEYELNTDLSAVQEATLLQDIQYFGFQINSLINYMYVDGIFGGIHEAQLYVEEVLGYGEESVVALEEIQDINVLANYDYDLKELNTDTFETVDLAEEQEMLQLLSAEYEQDLTLNQQDFVMSYEDLNNHSLTNIDQVEESQSSLETNLDGMSDNFSLMEDWIDNSTSAIDSQVVYDSILNIFYIGASLEELLVEVDDVLEIKPQITLSMEEIRNNTALITSSSDAIATNKTKVDPSLMDYNQQLALAEACAKDVTSQACVDLGTLGDVENVLTSYETYLNNELANVQNQLAAIATAYANGSNPNSLVQNEDAVINEISSNYQADSNLYEMWVDIDNNLLSITNYVNNINAQTANVDTLLVQIDELQVAYENLIAEGIILTPDQALIADSILYYTYDDNTTGEIITTSRFIYKEEDGQQVLYYTDIDGRNEKKVNTFTDEDNISVVDIFEPLCSTAPTSLVCQQAKVLEEFNKLEMTIESGLSQELASLSLMFDSSFDQEDNPVGDFYNAEDTTLQTDKTSPVNLYAYLEGYYYCVGENNNYYYATPDQACASGEAPQYEKGIEDYLDITDLLLADTNTTLKTAPEMAEIDQEYYMSEKAVIDEQMTSDIVTVETFNNELFGNKVDVYNENQTILLEYVQEVTTDPSYQEKTAEEIADQQANNEQAETYMSSFSNLLPNSKVGTIDNTILYDFIVNPLEMMDKTATTFEEIIVEEGRKILRLLFLILILLSIPLGAYRMYTKDSKEDGGE